MIIRPGKRMCVCSTNNPLQDTGPCIMLPLITLKQQDVHASPLSRTKKVNCVCDVDRFRRRVVDDLGLRKLWILQKIFENRADVVGGPEVEGPCTGFISNVVNRLPESQAKNTRSSTMAIGVCMRWQSLL